MTTAEQHAIRSADHEGFAGAVSGVTQTERQGWQVTALYYATLRAVDGYLGGQSQSPVNHEERKRMMLADAKAKQIYADYKMLERQSHLSRYSGGGLADRHVAAAVATLSKVRSTLGV